MCGVSATLEMKQILYVEDSGLSQHLMKRFVSGLGELSSCENLTRAAAIFRERTFDLLITDFRFRDGEAIDLIQNIRQTLSPMQMPIIVVSSMMDNLLLNRVLRAGANEAFIKPLQMDYFRSVVTKMLEAPYVRRPEVVEVSAVCF